MTLADLATDPDYAAFLAAIAAAPDDDAPRLVFADWLQERGQEERGELIRVQCELAKLYLTFPEDTDHHAGFCDVNYCGLCDLREKRAALKHRQRELLYKATWCLPGEDRWGLGTTPDEIHVAPSAVVRRGFIESVRVEAQWWVWNGDAILRLHPVETVTLVGQLQMVGPAENPEWRCMFRGRPPGKSEEEVAAEARDEDGQYNVRLPLLRLEWPQVKKWVLPGTELPGYVPVDYTRSTAGERINAGDLVYWDNLTATVRPARENRRAR